MMSLKNFDYLFEQLRKPSAASYRINVALIILGVGNFYASVPSGPDYSERVGVARSFSGFLLAGPALFALFFPLLWNRLAVHPSCGFRLIFMVILACRGVLNVFWALAETFDSPWMLVISRSINGALFSGSISMNWISKTHGRERVRAAAGEFSTLVSAGTMFGILSGGIFYYMNSRVKLCDGWYLYFDRVTMPGWFYAALHALLFLALWVWFEEPMTIEEGREAFKNGIPINGIDTKGDMAVWEVRESIVEDNKKKDDTEQQMEGDNVKNAGVAEAELEKDCDCQHKEYDDEHHECQGRESSEQICLWFCFLFVNMLNRVSVSCYESSAPLVTYQYFQWNMIETCCLLVGLCAFALIFNTLQGRYLKDVNEAKLAMIYLALGLGGAIISLQYSSNADDYSPAQYVIGSFFMFVLLPLWFSMMQSICTKLLPIRFFNNFVDIGSATTTAMGLGRFVGAIYGTRFDELTFQVTYVSAFLGGIHLVGIVVLLAWYPTYMKRYRLN